METLFFESEVDKQFEIASLKAQIAIESTLNDFQLENDIVSESENGNGSENKLKSTVEKMVNAILDFIKTIGDTIRSAFSTDKGIDYESLMKSENFQVRMKQDLAEVEKRANQKVREGSELIQKISRGTHIPDTVVQKFITDGPKTIATVAPIAIGGAAAIGYYNKYSNNSIFKSMTDTVKNIKETAKAPDAKAGEQISTILGGLFQIIQSASKSTVEGMNAIARECNKQGIGK